MTDRTSTANGRIATARTSHGFGGVRSSEPRRRSPHTSTADIIPLGDFNLPKAEPGDPIYDQLTGRGLQVPEHSTQIGSSIALLDASRPDNALLRAGHAVYFNRAVPMIGGLISNREAYAYLPRSMEYLPSGQEIVAMPGDAGFADAGRTQLSGGLTQLFTGTHG